MPSIDQAMSTLTNQWYNAVTAGLGLQSNSDQYNSSNGAFQLFQGNNPLVTQSTQLWDIFDAIPPASVSNYYDPAQSNNFSQDYGAVLNMLRPQTAAATSFMNCMGDYYAKWQSYLQGLTPIPTDLGAEFKKWCTIYAPDKSSCYGYLIQSLNDPIVIALDNYAAATAANSGYAYNKTIDMLTNSLGSNKNSKSFTLNSNTTSSNTSETWASGGISVNHNLFNLNASVSYDALTSKAFSAGINMSVTFSNQVTFQAGPLAKVDTDPILSEYTPWYNSAAFSAAYATKDNTMWKPGTPNWLSTFGANGNMQRQCVAIVVVDGINITLSSSADYSEADQQNIEASLETGVWPFFKANGEGGYSNSVDFSDSGEMTITQTSPQGNPIVLGVLVTSTASQLSK